MKILLFISTFFVSVSALCQNRLNLTVKADYIHVYSEPSSQGKTEGNFLEKNERIALITDAVETRLSSEVDYYFRIYRKNDNTKPYYINYDEFSLNKKTLEVHPGIRAVVDSREIPFVWANINNRYFNKGDIFFYDGHDQMGIYSQIDFADFRSSRLVSLNDYAGFYKVDRIVSCKVQDESKVLYTCVPLNSPFNNRSEKIFVDLYKGSASLNFQKIDQPSTFSILMLQYSLNTSQTPPADFYLDYLRSLFGYDEILRMDEFRKNKLLQTGKSFMDSVYGTRTDIYKKTFTNFFLTSVKQYDFDSNSFTVEGLSNRENELWALSDRYFEVVPKSVSNFFNLKNVDPKIKLPVDSAELFLKEIKQFPINNDFENREIVMLVHYRFLPPEHAKSLNLYVGDNLTTANYPKFVLGIEIFTGKHFTKDQIRRSLSSEEPDPRNLKKWAMLFPTH